MFDVYMHAHAIDPRARQRMAALFGVAALATTVSIGSALVGEKLDISRVGAPRVEGILVLPMEVTPAPPLPPPPRLEPNPDPSETAAVTPTTSPDPKPPVEHSDDAPLDDPRATDPPATRVGPPVIGNTPI